MPQLPAVAQRAGSLHSITQLQAAYLEAQRRGIQRDTAEYFNHIEDQLGVTSGGGSLTPEGF
jgi:hypothetical protein